MNRDRRKKKLKNDDNDEKCTFIRYSISKLVGVDGNKVMFIHFFINKLVNDFGYAVRVEKKVMSVDHVWEFMRASRDDVSAGAVGRACCICTEPQRGRLVLRWSVCVRV